MRARKPCSGEKKTGKGAKERGVAGSPYLHLRFPSSRLRQVSLVHCRARSSLKVTSFSYPPLPAHTPPPQPKVSILDSVLMICLPSFRFRSLIDSDSGSISLHLIFFYDLLGRVLLFFSWLITNSRFVNEFESASHSLSTQNSLSVVGA